MDALSASPFGFKATLVLPVVSSDAVLPWDKGLQDNGWNPPMKVVSLVIGENVHLHTSTNLLRIDTFNVSTRQPRPRESVLRHTALVRPHNHRCLFSLLLVLLVIAEDDTWNPPWYVA